jgi:hypothetical protein
MQLLTPLTSQCLCNRPPAHEAVAEPPGRLQLLESLGCMTQLRVVQHQLVPVLQDLRAAHSSQEQCAGHGVMSAGVRACRQMAQAVNPYGQARPQQHGSSSSPQAPMFCELL